MKYYKKLTRQVRSTSTTVWSPSRFDPCSGFFLSRFLEVTTKLGAEPQHVVVTETIDY